MAGGLIQRLLGKTQPDGSTGLSARDLNRLAKAFASLDKVEAGLARAARDYVVKGTGDSVLLRLGNAGDAGHAHLLRRFSACPVAVHTARDELLLQADGWDAPVLRRLGEVYAAVCVSNAWLVRYWAGTNATPIWFRCLIALVRDALQHATASAGRPTGLLDASRCCELLALDDRDETALVDVLFAPQADRTLLDMPGLVDVIGAAAAPVAASIWAYPAGTRAAFMAWLGHAGLAGDPAWFAVALAAMTDTSKSVREAALVTLKSCETAQVRTAAEEMLDATAINDRLAAVRLLTHVVGPDAVPFLEARAATETAPRVRQAIEEAMHPLVALKAAADTPADDETGYVSIDGDRIAIPAVPPMPEDTPPPADTAAVFEAAARAANAEARREFEQIKARKLDWAPKSFDEPFPVRKAALFSKIMDGSLTIKKAGAEALASGHGQGDGYWFPSSRLLFQKEITTFLARPEVTLHHLARLIVPHHNDGWIGSAILGSGQPGGGIGAAAIADRVRAGTDPRLVFAITGAQGITGEVIIRHLLRQGYWSPRSWVPAGAWLVAVTYLPILDEAFGLVPSPPDADHSSTRALDQLKLFPAPPRRYLQPLLDLAARGHKESKAAARALLAGSRTVSGFIPPLLQSGDRAVRIGAADWLVERRERGAIPVLRIALEREKTDLGRAALISALDALGDDVSDQFAEDRLVGEAEKGLARTRTRLKGWFPFESLPALTWNDGRPVPPVVVRWWVVLADKLKRPGGDPLLHLALDRLDRASGALLGAFALSAFIAQDTRMPTEQEANAKAEAGADQRHQAYLRWDKTATREAAFAQIKTEVLKSYLGSAHEHRGMLALARHAPGSEAVAMVRAFFRDHYGRTAQCKALLECLAAGPSPVGLQFVLSISQRWRTPGVQKHAAALIKTVAEEKGWTRDELADRTVPDGGFAADGARALDINGKPWRFLLDEDLKVAIENPDGKRVKALPKPADGDAGVEAAQARKRLSALRKEVPQTIAMQTARLYEAMCAERTWQAADVETFLLRHPIVSRLCRRLVFLGLDGSSAIVGSFRPLDDGSLTDAADNAVAMASFTRIKLAHRTLMDDAAVAAWRTHIADYEVIPLFEQFERPQVTGAGDERDATVVTDRRGYMMDTFTLRGAATRLGWQRGAAEDGGVFIHYEKRFLTAGIAARIEFTGSYLPETNRPAALVGLSFVPIGEGDWPDVQRLDAVPKVLASEVRNDFHTIAAAGTGFDPQWEKKASW